MENNTQVTDKNQVVPEILSPQQALALLIQGVNFAQSKGVFNLQDAELLSKAVRTFSGEKKEEKKEEEAKSTEGHAPVAQDTEATAEQTSN